MLTQIVNIFNVPSTQSECCRFKKNKRNTIKKNELIINLFKLKCLYQILIYCFCFINV